MTDDPTTQGTSAGNTSAYARAGVDIEAGDRAVELMKAHVRRTQRPEVLGGLGGFAGFFDASAFKNYRHPVLATSTDGVGTKVAIAQAMDRHDTIGFDLIGMLVDDLVVSGAEPLFVTDYIACGKVVPERIADIVRGIAGACASAGVALVGGETAEHPGLLGVDEYDVAGAATGAVEADDLLGPERVNTGDVLIGLPASGLHSNGYSLVRRIIADAGWALDREVPEFSRTLGEEILTPTRVYSGDLAAILDARPGAVHAMSHVTGGGLSANVARVIPPGTLARMHRASWEVPAVFDVLGDLGQVPQADRERTWNLGVGMVLAVDPAAAEALLAALPGSWLLGEVSDDDGTYASDPYYVQGAKGVDGGAAILLD